MQGPNGHGWIGENGDIRIDWIDQLSAPLSLLEYISCRSQVIALLVDARAVLKTFLVQMPACVATSVKIRETSTHPTTQEQMKITEVKLCNVM